MALALLLVIPSAPAAAQEDPGDLTDVFGPPAPAPEEPPAGQAVPDEPPIPAEPPAEEPPPRAPGAAEEAAATGYGAAGLPVSVAGAELQNNWRLMVHYARLARYDLARGHGEQVLAATPTPLTVLALVESPSTSYAEIVKLATVADMGDVPARILTLADEGMRMKRTDAARIQANLLRLAEGPRAYYNAMKELKYSGPYVVPHALGVLQDPSRKELHSYVIRALAEIGQPVVLPLMASLDTPNQTLREMIVGVLGEIGYPYALAPLKAIVESTSAGEGVKTAATRAILKIADESVLRTPAKRLYLELAEKYYYNRIIVGDLRQETTDLFEWVKDAGLIYKAAPSKSMNEILAARACADALRADPRALEAVATWVAAMMQMEAELEGKTARQADPFLPDDMPSVDFFARAVGQQHLYKVLDRALRDSNTPVAVRASRALEDVANEKFLMLYGQGDVGSPLVLALDYPDQRVRFAAAFALAAIRPKNTFTGAGKVVPVLVEALNLEAGKTLLLAESEADNRNRLQAALKEAGWNVVPATSGNEALSKAREMARIDAVVISSRIRNVSHADAISLLRSDYQTAMTPIIVLSYPDDPVKGTWLESRIRYVKAVEPAIEVDPLAGVVEELKRAAGSLVLDEAAARKVSLHAALVLKEIAVASQVYSGRGARASLLQALSNRPDELVVAVLDALAELPDGEIARAMANVGTDANRSKTVRVSALKALARASRSVGNELRPEQIDAIQALAVNPDDELRDAAGEALGGLDLDAASGAELILKHGAS